MGKKKQKIEHEKIKAFRTTAFAELKNVVVLEKVPATVPAIAQPAKKPVEDDALLFQQAMADICPLKTQKASAKAASVVKNDVQNNTRVREASVESEMKQSFMNEIGRLKLEVTFVEELSNEDELKPLSGNRLRQLKRGVVSVESQLDLHGLTKDEALFELPRFLRSAQGRGDTAVLVITGKGNNSNSEPVLQQAVAGWLRDAGRDMISEFAPAPREMGGNGAFVVFIKKRKHHAERGEILKGE